MTRQITICSPSSGVQRRANLYNPKLLFSSSPACTPCQSGFWWEKGLLSGPLAEPGRQGCVFTSEGERGFGEEARRSSSRPGRRARPPLEEPPIPAGMWPSGGCAEILLHERHPGPAATATSRSQQAHAAPFRL